MKVLQGKLALLATAGLSFILGFGFLAWQNFSDSQKIMSGLGQSSQVLSLAQAIVRGNKKDLAIKELEALSPELEPNFRTDTVKKFMANSTKANMALLIDSESRFQKYSFELSKKRAERVYLYSSLALAFCTLMTLIFLAVNNRSIFARLGILNNRMLDFLENKYSYEFETPEESEIGELEQTFNRAAQRVLDQIEALKKLDLAKSEFLSIASHELRTPLTSIKGSLSLMQAGVVGEFNDASKSLMNIALTETDRLIRLINDLLDLAKIEAGGFSVKAEWSDVESLLQKTKASLAGFAASAGVHLEVECKVAIDGLLDLDRTQQVLTNLASNAIKFSPEGSTVILRAQVSVDRKLQFEVIDQGPGIAPQDQEIIFEKFRQVTSPDNPLVKGTGLGLAIAKGLVEEQGGSIHVKSAPKQGSTFYFYLPQWKLKTANPRPEAA